MSADRLVFLGCALCAAFMGGYDIRGRVEEGKREAEMGAMVPRPIAATTAATFLTCPALNARGIEEWARICRARSHMEALTQGEKR